MKPYESEVVVTVEACRRRPGRVPPQVRPDPGAAVKPYEAEVVVTVEAEDEANAREILDEALWEAFGRNYTIEAVS